MTHSDLPARFAAPVWALVWLLTLGKFGAPLWRRPKRERVTSADLALLSPRSRAMWLMQAAQGCPPLFAQHRARVLDRLFRSYGSGADMVIACAHCGRVPVFCEHPVAWKDERELAELQMEYRVHRSGGSVPWPGPDPGLEMR